jgi:hypothetical protein
MGIQKKLTYIGLFFAFIVLIYFLFSTDDSSKTKKMTSDEMSFLFATPGGNSGSSNSKGNPMGLRGENSKSVFDSDFYSSGNFSYDEMQAQKEEGEKGAIPINPQTGKPYEEAAMQQFDRLREYFPENELIPKRLTPEVKAQQEAKAEKLAEATRKVMSGNPERADLNEYYGNMEKQANDRLEIIEYLIDVQGGDSPEMDEKFKQVLDGVKAQMAQIQSEKEQAFKRAGL